MVGNTLSGSVSARFASMSSMNGSTSPGSPSFRSNSGAMSGTTAQPKSITPSPAITNSPKQAETSLLSSPRVPVACNFATNRTRHAAMPRSKSVKYATTPSTKHHTP